jgi:hypothetical protein
MAAVIVAMTTGHSAGKSCQQQKRLSESHNARSRSKSGKYKYRRLWSLKEKDLKERGCKGMAEV